MSEPPFFCVGCNEPTEPAPGGLCPRCGQAVTPGDLTPTQHVDGSGALADSRDAGLEGHRLGNYDVESFLGKGGMARVYRARHRMLHRPCALKVLAPELASRDPEYLSLFLDEARAAAALVHPNVVTVHNIGNEDGLNFIEMEYVSGRALQGQVAADAPDPLRATGLMLQISAGLAEAHRVGIIHRDLKPSNVMLTHDGIAKLADFGLAKRVEARSPLPAEHTLVGTPYFMAPELFEGTAASRQSDVYAAGVTYFYLLTGRLPFADRSIVALARKHAKDPVPDLGRLRPDTPAQMTALLSHCLAKRPDQRLPDAAALREELRGMFGKLRPLGALVDEAARGLDVERRDEDGVLLLRVRLPNRRTQLVRVEATGSSVEEELVRIYSVCAPLDEGYARRALELNARVPHAALAIQDVAGRPHFVMVSSYPRATCDPEEVRAAVLNIAFWADHVEAQLTGGDVH
jgi:serine/threonine-protein kinase